MTTDDPASPPLPGQELSDPVQGLFWRFEAEYHDSLAVALDDNTNEKFFYKSCSNVGYNNPIFQYGFSNKFYWRVDKGVAGYAFGDLLRRWPIPGTDSYHRIGSEFKLADGSQTGYPQPTPNKLNITFRFACSLLKADLPDTTILARFTFTTHRGSIAAQGSHAPAYPLRHRYADGSTQQVTCLTKADIVNNGEAHEYTFSIAVEEMIAQGAVVESGEYYQLHDINPLMYWYGHGTLKLDYVEFHDDVHDRWANTPRLIAGMRPYRYCSQR